MKKILLLIVLLTACQKTNLFDVQAEACDTSALNQSNSTHQTWKNIEYDLPSCWVAKKNEATSGPQLWLIRGENLEGDYQTHLVFEQTNTSFSELAAALPTIETRGVFLLGEKDYEAHLYVQKGGDSMNDAYYIEYGPNPYWTVDYDGENFEDSEVQFILNSLIINE